MATVAQKLNHNWLPSFEGAAATPILRSAAGVNQCVFRAALT